MKDGQALTENRSAYPDAIFKTMREPFLVLDAGFKVRAASKYFYETFQIQPQDVLGFPVFDLNGGLWNVPGFRELLENVLHDSSEFSDYGMELDFPGTGRKLLLVNSRKLLDEETGEESIFLAIQDMTPIKRAEEEFRQFIYAVSHDLQQPLSKMITISELLTEKLNTLEGTEKDYLIRMHEAGKRMKQFIDDLTRDSASHLKSASWMTSKKK